VFRKRNLKDFLDYLKGWRYINIRTTVFRIYSFNQFDLKYV